jgi:AcrR family transcriptional regulator
MAEKQQSQGRKRQRETAERNTEAILDAAERLLERREPATISAVAAESGISRVTVYGHFTDANRLLEAVVERAVRQAMLEIERVEPNRGPAPEALDRMLGAGWQELGRTFAIADAAASSLSAEAMHRTHVTAYATLRRLVKRGRSAGEFRDDVPVDWLVSAFFSLIHTARNDVSAGATSAASALRSLRATVPDLFGVSREG